MLEESFSRGEPLSEAVFRAALEGAAKTAVQDIHVLRTVDSTNTYAKNLAKNGAEHVTVVMAEEQTAGRGRFGRNFYSPAHSGLYMSLLFKSSVIPIKNEKTQNGPFDPALFTVAAAVAVTRALQDLYRIQAGIKWVNDIYLDGKKICGILAEGANPGQSGIPACIVIGIGINVVTEDFPGELKEKASSLSISGNKGSFSDSNAVKNTDRNLLAAKILSKLMELFEENKSVVFAEYRRRSCILGKQIIVIEGQSTFSAVAADIDENGCLIAEMPDKTRRVLHSAEVSIRGNF